MGDVIRINGSCGGTIAGATNFLDTVTFSDPVEDITVPTGGDLDIWLGDTAGATSMIINDSGGADKFIFTSDGEMTIATDATYTDLIGSCLQIGHNASFTGVGNEIGVGAQITPTVTITDPTTAAGFDYVGFGVDMSGVSTISGTGATSTTGLGIVTCSDANADGNFGIAMADNYNDASATYLLFISEDGIEAQVAATGSNEFSFSIVTAVPDYDDGKGLLDLTKTGNFTGATGESNYLINLSPELTATAPAAGTHTFAALDIDMTSFVHTPAAGTLNSSAIRVTSGADASWANGQQVYIQGISDQDSYTVVNIDADTMGATNGNIALKVFMGDGGHLGTAGHTASSIVSGIDDNASDVAGSFRTAFFSDFETDNSGGSLVAAYAVGTSATGGNNFDYSLVSVGGKLTIGTIDVGAGDGHDITIVSNSATSGNQDGGSVNIGLGDKDGSGDVGEFTINLSNDDTDGVYLVLFKDTASPATSDIVGEITYFSKNSTDQEINYGDVWVDIVSPTNGSETGRLGLGVHDSASSNDEAATDYIILDGSSSSENVLFPKTATTYVDGVGIIDIIRTGNYTGISGEETIDLNVAPTNTIIEPATGTHALVGIRSDMSGITITNGGGATSVAAAEFIVNTRGSPSVDYALRTVGNVNFDLQEASRFWIDAATITRTEEDPPTLSMH